MQRSTRSSACRTSSHAWIRWGWKPNRARPRRSRPTSNPRSPSGRRSSRRPASPRIDRARCHVPAARAGAALLRAVEFLVGARYRVHAVIGHVLHALVEHLSAVLAEPGEPVALPGAPLALEDQHVGVGRETG